MINTNTQEFADDFRDIMMRIGITAAKYDLRPPMLVFPHEWQPAIGGNARLYADDPNRGVYQRVRQYASVNYTFGVIETDATIIRVR